MKIWRYLQYSKFVAMLKSNALHFSRADQFPDLFEGSYPRKNQKNYPSMSSPKHTYEAFKKYVAISCWHRNQDESEAMWELYLRNSDGVAIVTDKKTLEECLEGTEATVVEVQYKNYRKDQIDDFTWFKAFEYKRKCFNHEREIRANIYRLPPSPEIVNGFPEIGPPDGRNCVPDEGIKIDIDLSKLIKKVVISPRSGAWFEDVVRETLRNYSLQKIKVYKSELADDPIYPHWST